MIPVMLLSDGYIANGSEPWMIPEVKKLKILKIISNRKKMSFYHTREMKKHLQDHGQFLALKVMEHRIGGLEKEDLLEM